MKTTLALCLSIALLSTTFTGCTTSTNPDGSTHYVVDTIKVNRLIDANVPGAVEKAAKSSERAKTIITEVKVGVCLLSHSENVTPDDLRRVCLDAGVNLDAADDASIIASGFISTYSIFFEDAVKAHLAQYEIVAQFQPILGHLCDAIGLGLDRANLAFIDRETLLQRASDLFSANGVQSFEIKLTETR